MRYALSVFQEPSTRSIYNIGKNPQTDIPYTGTDPIYTPTPNPETNTLKVPK